MQQFAQNQVQSWILSEWDMKRQKESSPAWKCSASVTFPPACGTWTEVSSQRQSPERGDTSDVGMLVPTAASPLSNV